MSEPSYDTTLHAVDDLGATPDAETPLRLDDDRIGPNTDVVVPDGVFAVAGRTTVDGGSVRFRAADGAAPVFRPPPGHNGFLTNVDCDHFAFEGIDVDVSEGVAGFGVEANSFEVADVEFRGRGTHPDADVVHCFVLAVTDPDGEGTVRNVTALKGSAWARYKDGDGRGFMWVAPGHVGTLTVRNCRVAEFGNNGVYGSAAEGPIVVEDSEFWNNNVASVRFGSDGCVMRNTVVGVDADRYTGPREPRFEADSFFMRAVWVEAKRGALAAPGWVTIADSTVVVRDVPTGQGGVVVRPNAGALSVREGTVVDVRGDVDAPPIEAQRPGPTGPDYRRHGQPDPPYDLALDTVRLSGAGPADAAVAVTGRDVAARRTLITFDDDRDGVRVTDGSCTLMDCHIGVGGETAVVDVSPGHVGGEPIIRPRLTQRNVSGRTDAATWRSLLADRSASFERTTSHLGIAADGETVAYELVAATGSTLEATDPEAGTATDVGLTASGEVEPDGRATYRLRGALVSAWFSGGATVTLDGAPVDRGALVAATRRREAERLSTGLDRRGE